jgi:hypothetical protein
MSMVGNEAGHVFVSGGIGAAGAVTAVQWLGIGGQSYAHS